MAESDPAVPVQPSSGLASESESGPGVPEAALSATMPAAVPPDTPVTSRGTYLLRGRHVVRLAPEYCCTSPLWPKAPDGGADGLVPVAVLERLVAWERVFLDYFEWEDGWQSDLARERWAEEAEVVADVLRAALPPDVALVVDLWPLREE